MAIGLGLSLAAGCTSEGAPVPVESYEQTNRDAAITQRQQEGFVVPPIGQVVLSRSNMCAWTPERPLPQPSGDAMLVDGRCAFPMPADGDPANDHFGVYEIPTQDSSPVQRSVYSGTLVVGLCFTVGQRRQDGKGRWSQMWVKINTRQDGSGKVGYAPAFTTGYALPPKPC